jgi:DNA (cytosine-5)-methyltransferase 3A
MRVLSLFDGISCGRLALLRAGIPVTRYVASEIDGYAKIISRNNWLDIEQVGDVCKLDFEEGEFDLILAGSPCQGFSIAGMQLGFDDDRSKLYFEFLRLKNKIKPKFWLLENVPMQYAWQKRISNDLWYKPKEINSALVSAQVRRRLYWSNIPFQVPEDKGISLQDILIRDVEVLRPYKMNKTPSRDQMWIRGCPNITRRDKSNCLTTKQDRWGNAGLVEYEDYARYLTEIECERLQTLPDNYTFGVPSTQRYKALGNCWTVDVIAHILKNIQK